MDTDIKQAEFSKRPIDELILWEENPRTWMDVDIARLKEQIKRLGIYKPVLINQDNVILGGNMRVNALREMGVREVLVTQVHTKDTAEMVEYALSDNDSVGRYEEQKLAELLSKYQVNLDIYQVDLGKPSSLEDVISKYAPLEGEESDVDAEDLSSEPPISKTGELYKLGTHRLYCGDATKWRDVEKLMGGVLANLVFTDPPYMVDYHSPAGNTYDSKKFGDSGKMFNDNLSEEEAQKFYVKCLKNLYKASKDTAPIYWWFAQRNAVINREAFKASGWFASQTLIWLKNSMIFSTGQDFHRIYEPMLFGWKQGKTHFTNKRIANYKDVFSLDKEDFEELLDIWYAKRDNTQEYIHPTQKPVSLCKRALKKHSRRGHVVLDLFGGSGSTLMACEEMDRVGYIMELDPKYCDAIRKRYAKAIMRGEQWQEATPVLST